MRVELPGGTPAELALPDGTPTRGVVLFPDIMGLRPLFDELAARLAAEHGWAVCVPEPFPGRTGLTIDERLPLLADYDDERALAAGEAAAALLRQRGATPVAALGFCMGGSLAMKATPRGPYDRGVAFYGQVQGVGSLPVVVDAAKPVLLLAGLRDPLIPPRDLDEVEAAGVQVVRYPEAEHGFVHDPARPAHRPDDAADAWRRAVEFLA